MDRKHRCFECGGSLERGVRAVTLEYEDQLARVNLPGWYCDGCDESIHDTKDTRVSDRALNAMKAKHRGLLTPEQIKAARQSVRLTQKQAATLFGGGSNAFQKYESGEVLPSQALSKLLFLVWQSPAEDRSRMLEAVRSMPAVLKGVEVAENPSA